MSDEKLRILRMLEENKLTADEAARLLKALDGNTSTGAPAKARWLKIRVYEGNPAQPKVKVTVPISLAKIAAKLGGKFQMAIPDEARQRMSDKGIQLDAETFEKIDELFEELAVNGRFDLVKVQDEEDGDKVEIYVE